MEAADKSHFVELKVRVVREISSDLSEGRFSAMVDHFAHLTIADSAELERIKDAKDVDSLLRLLEAENKLSPNCVGALETVANLANNPLATELVKQYKCFEKLEGVSNESERIPSARPTVDEAATFVDKNCNEQLLTLNSNVPSKPTMLKRENECRRMSFTEERQAAVDYVVCRLGHGWQEVAYRLDIFGDRQILNSELDCIDNECRYMKEKIRRMFNLWIEDQGKEATVRCLISALRKARRVALAEQLEDGFHQRDAEYNEPEETIVPTREPVEG